VLNYILTAYCLISTSVIFIIMRAVYGSLFWMQLYYVTFAVHSLVNIFKELASDIEGFEQPGHGDLTGWATQGGFPLLSPFHGIHFNGSVQN